MKFILRNIELKFKLFSVVFFIGLEANLERSLEGILNAKSLNPKILILFKSFFGYFGLPGGEVNSEIFISIFLQNQKNYSSLQIFFQGIFFFFQG